MIPVTPRGFKDVLPSEAQWREAIVSATRDVLSLWGYAPIETPSLEILDVLEQGGELSSNPFRLFDTDNELLVLRPDVTLQVARMVASRLNTSDLPLRLRYVERIFREEEGLKALSREFTQIGVEAIGLEGASADAEIVLVLVDVLKTAGLKDYSISLGTVGVLRELLALCEESGAVDAEWGKTMLDAFHSGNLVVIDQLASEEKLDARYAAVLKELPNITGKAEAIEKVEALVAPLGIADGLEQLKASYAIIEACNLTSRVEVDFSIVSSYDYYTGLVLEAYAPGVGKALGTGGRYDRMLEGFGVSAPAAGFALSLEAIMQALVNQESKDGNLLASKKAPEILSINHEDPAETFIRAGALRAEGTAVVLRESLNNETGVRND